MIFSIISTIATLLNDIGAEMGGAIDIICIAIYMAAIGITSYGGYDRTVHVPPSRTKQV
ncbi:MAG TPA: hypothetical protein VFT64_05225 [Rickettsiales bacterium]|nr:hypothetical protein [Rickettsiales bacterium]